MKHKKWLMALIAVSVLSLAACKDDEPTKTAAPEIPVIETTTPNEPNEPNVVEETDEKATEEVTVDEEAKTILTSTGTYISTVDAEHVKIQIGGETSVYTLIAETKGIFEGVDANASITFDYYETSAGERVLVSLLLNEAVSEKPIATGEVKKDEWTFVGMIDGHSSEFKKGNTFIVAQHGEAQFETINNLPEDASVRVEYTVNENGTYVLTSITKK